MAGIKSEFITLLGNRNIAQQNAGEGSDLLRGVSGVPGSGKFKLLSELLGFKRLAPQLPVMPFYDIKIEFYMRTVCLQKILFIISLKLR